MVAVKLNVVIGEDRRLVIDLPDDVPVGPAEITIQPEIASDESDDALRARLIAAGLLVNPDEMDIPDDIEFASDEELEALGKLPPGAPSIQQLIDEDRGAY
jgi:hypothetical protein